MIPFPSRTPSSARWRAWSSNNGRGMAADPAQSRRQSAGSHALLRTVEVRDQRPRRGRAGDEAAMKTSANWRFAPAAGAPLAPLLAGARARGWPSGLELIRAAAALIGDEGEVLHVNPRALRPARGRSDPDRRRLRARGAAHAGETLAAAINSTLRDQVASRALSLRTRGLENDGLRVRIMPVAAERDGSVQLLRAVAILEPRGAAARAGLVALN